MLFKEFSNKNMLIIFIHGGDCPGNNKLKH